jgi:nitrogenase molybdenum-iron protein NifN
VIGGRRVALALEPDLLFAVASLMAEAGAEIVAAVAPQQAGVLADVPCEEVVIGDLADLEARAADGRAELVIAASHARAAAARLGAAHLCLGFPVYDRLGAQLRRTAGYSGSLALLIDAANCLLDHEHITHQRTVMEETRC